MLERQDQAEIRPQTPASRHKTTDKVRAPASTRPSSARATRLNDDAQSFLASTFAPWANGHTPHVTEPISAVLGYKTRLKCHNDVVTLNPKDPTWQHHPARSCPDRGILRLPRV